MCPKEITNILEDIRVFSLLGDVRIKYCNRSMNRNSDEWQKRAYQ